MAVGSPTVAVASPTVAVASPAVAAKSALGDQPEVETTRTGRHAAPQAAQFGSADQRVALVPEPVSPGDTSEPAACPPLSPPTDEAVGNKGPPPALVESVKEPLRSADPSMEGSQDIQRPSFFVAPPVGSRMESEPVRGMDQHQPEDHPKLIPGGKIPTGQTGGRSESRPASVQALTPLLTLHGSGSHPSAHGASNLLSPHHALAADGGAAYYLEKQRLAREEDVLLSQLTVQEKMALAAKHKKEAEAFAEALKQRAQHFMGTDEAAISVSGVGKTDGRAHASNQPQGVRSPNNPLAKDMKPTTACKGVLPGDRGAAAFMTKKQQEKEAQERETCLTTKEKAEFNRQQSFKRRQFEQEMKARAQGLKHHVAGATTTLSGEGSTAVRDGGTFHGSLALDFAAELCKKSGEFGRGGYAEDSSDAARSGARGMAADGAKYTKDINSAAPPRDLRPAEAAATRIVGDNGISSDLGDEQLLAELNDDDIASLLAELDDGDM